MICPIKAREFPVDGQSIECSSECAKLMDVWRICGNNHEYFGRVCADAAIALDTMEYETRPCNVMGVDE